MVAERGVELGLVAEATEVLPAVAAETAAAAAFSSRDLPYRVACVRRDFVKTSIACTVLLSFSPGIAASTELRDSESFKADACFSCKPTDDWPLSEFPDETEAEARGRTASASRDHRRAVDVGKPSASACHFAARVISTDGLAAAGRGGVLGPSQPPWQGLVAARAGRSTAEPAATSAAAATPTSPLPLQRPRP